jgi:single-strand DNA-binding protein
MGSYNKVLLMGNLTRDIEVRHLPSGQAVGNIGLAVNRRWRDQNSGEMREEVTFVDCEAWGKTAENMAKFFTKGRPVFIEGRLKLDTWQDKTDGSNRSKLKVVVESFEFVDSKGGDGGGGAGGGSGGGGGAVVTRGGQRGRPAASGAAPAPDTGVDEDDIPF